MSVSLSEIKHQAASDDVCEIPALTQEARVERMRAELEETAYREWSRQRRRLGDLTPEQECALETLLLSVTDRISHLLIRQLHQSTEAKASQPVEFITREESINSSPSS